jgi:hypothetical protein
LTMAKNLKKIAHALGADIVGQIPDVGGGAFGAARLAKILQARLQPSGGQRPGRPTDPSWVFHPKVPMSKQTMQKLTELAEQVSTPERKVSPMQVAAQILENALEKHSGEKGVAVATADPRRVSGLKRCRQGRKPTPFRPVPQREEAALAASAEEPDEEESHDLDASGRTSE